MRRGSTLFAWVLSLALAASCVDPEPPALTCTDGRSRCVTQVSLGARFGCALLRDRSVWCWGRNDESQLGYPTTDLCPEELPNGMTRSVACHAFPFQVLGLDKAVKLTTGSAFACAQRDDGTVRCWGSNTAGQLGNGLTLPSQTPVSVRGLTGVTALAAGARHACALAGKQVLCWGANDRGQLGLARTSRTCATPEGTIPCEPEPTAVQGLDDAVALTAGDAHTCAITAEGYALCWGDGRYGQLGVGSARTAPVAMPEAVRVNELPIERIRDLVAGAQHTCARTEEGQVWCWGRNDRGEVGSPAGTTVPERCEGPCAPTPVRVPELDARPVDAAVDAAFDATADANDGSANDGSANDGAGGEDGGAPDVRPMRDGAVNDGPSSDGGVRDAGARDAVADDGSGPVEMRDAVAAPSMVPRGIAAGGAFGCAVLEDGTVRCWGDDGDGQLGDGRRVRDPQGPVMVIATPGAARTNPLQGVASVAAGSASACALLSDGSLRCWGSNQSGALGNGTTSVQSGPVPVTW